MGHCYFVIYVLGTRKCIIFYAYLCHINFFFHFFSMQCKSIKIQTSSYTLGIIETTLFYAIQHNKARKNAQRLCFIFNLYHKGSHGSAWFCISVQHCFCDGVAFFGSQKENAPKLCDTADGREDYNHIQMYTFYWTSSCLIYFYFGSRCYT